MNHRHPTDAERQQIRQLVTDIGPVEVLRLLGQIIANDHPTSYLGDDCRRSLFKEAAWLHDSLRLGRTSA